MGNSIFRRLFGKKEARILIMGLDAAGKTTSLYQMKLGEVVTTIPTIGFNVETVNIKNIAVTAWDVGGRNKIRPLYRHYYQNTRGLVYVVDSNDRERLDMAVDELQRVVNEDELEGIPVLILANKQDLPGALSPQKIASEFTNTLSKRPWTVYGVSAVDPNSSGLFEAFDWLVTSMETNEKKVIAETWIQAWYPASTFETTRDKQKEKKQIVPVDKKSFLNTFVESLKKMIM